jgi:hypothetical protein
MLADDREELARFLQAVVAKQTSDVLLAED